MSAANPHPTPQPATPPGEHFDPAELLDINRYPPASHTDLTLQRLFRDLAVTPPPAEHWQPLLNDLADRTPAARARHADLALRLRDLTPPSAADCWAARGAALEAHLTSRAAAFDTGAQWLAGQLRNLPVPPATAAQWAGREHAVKAQAARRSRDSERLEKITRDAPVHPRETTPDMRQSDWNAVEATLRQGRNDPPPPVEPRRWDALWNRIHHEIQPARASQSAPPASTTTPATNQPQAAAVPPPHTATTRSARTIRRPWKLYFTAFAAAAALVLLAVGLARLTPTGTTGTAHLPPEHPGPTATLATLTSAEILDMGDVDASVTSVVRTSSGALPITVVVIVGQ